MANNPYVNKVVYGNSTVMDISDTDTQESDVADGKVFYKGTGQRSVGTGNYYSPNDTAETDIQDGDYFPFYDTSATAKRKTLWSNIKAKLGGIFLNQSSQNVLGAKNLLDKSLFTPNSYSSITQLTTGIRTQITTVSQYSMGYVKTGAIKSPAKGKSLRFTANVTVTSGRGRVVILALVSAGGSYEYALDQDIPTSGLVDVTFNALNYDYWDVYLYSNSSFNAAGDVSYENLMITEANYTDNTYTPYTMTNEQLTNKTIEIVRTGVTVSANGTVRIPASGTDSRISTSSNQIITVVADLISNRPAKYKTLTVYDGYVNIVMAEALSNKNVGIQITNY